MSLNPRGQDAREAAFQEDVIADLQKAGWVEGHSSKYDKKRALYTEDCLAYVQQTQPKTWAKYTQLYPNDPETAFLDKLTAQLAKADPLATDKNLRTFGTLGVLRHGLRDKSASFKLCQFRPEHDLNPDTLAMYQGNILRVVPELVYSPHLSGEDVKSKRWRIDLVLFLNGIPLVTLELKSEFQQSVQQALRQYKKDRLPKDARTGKPEPLLTFKRGALVHFAVSQYEAYMTTRLAGDETRFLPFNRGTRDGGAGNEPAEGRDAYATGYLWNEVLKPENLLQIVGRFIHLEIKTEEAWDGRKTKQETLIFPRYHQWDLVTQLIETTRQEGPGHRYLVQHSAGSGKSNSIAWTAHQLSSLYFDAPERRSEKMFHSVIVVTDRTVLDSQLQDTIYQFEHADGVVGRINRDEGQGSKSQKLAAALEISQPIVIVTLQTFPFVLKAIEDSVSLKTRRYAILADEAHSSQSGRAASQLKEVLSHESTLAGGAEEAEEVSGETVSAEGVSAETVSAETVSAETVSAEDLLVASVEARRPSANLSFYAFTATPKSKTLELFGRRPRPEQLASKRNKPAAFHVYSMRQAIEEGYILDVLKNYTSYDMAYQLAQKAASDDIEVDSRKARIRLGQWVRLHETNIAQKVKVIVEHFRESVMARLDGKAKAMIVTGSRKEAVRYGLEFEKYVQKKGYPLTAMTAFSGEVEFSARDPHSEALLGKVFDEVRMNPGLKGRDMRRAFDTPEYQVMIVAEKFQTGFDQPKLCAMYVDKKLAGLACVQTLSRLNRKYPGKETCVVDFVNDPADVLAAFQVYYQTASLLDVSEPNLIWDLFDKLKAAEIFRWSEVVEFTEVFFTLSRQGEALSSICQPARDRWQKRRRQAAADFDKHKQLFERAKKLGDPVFRANAETDMREAKTVLDALDLFKSDLGSFSRMYEFLSQIVDYDSTDLEQLSLFARHLAPLLREDLDEDPVDLSSVELRDYRLSKIREQHLKLQVDAPDATLAPASHVGTGKARNQEEEWLSQIIQRLNELFSGEGVESGRLSERDLLNYATTIRDKVREDNAVMRQIQNNPPEQARLGDYPRALTDAVIGSGEVHQSQMLQYLNSKEVQAGFQRVIFDMLVTQFASSGAAGPL